MVKLSITSIGVLSGLIYYGRASPVTPQTVATSYATFSGSFTPPYSLAFLGLPYAEPPVDNLRFRRPIPLVTDNYYKYDVLDATAYPPPCVQGTTGRSGVGGEGIEDCLKVNIYKPVNATASSKLPVLFYIHGGGYQTGNPSNDPFDHWINQSPNIVVVTVYYRLASLGFLSHPSFADSSSGDFNVGIHDQTLALEWVKDNIAAFGGDPDQITINGESAGGGSVQLHLVAQESQGLFHAAIAQSIARIAMPAPEEKVDLFNFFASQAGCGTGTTDEVLTCLRAAPLDVISRAQEASSQFTHSDLNNWIPVLDGSNFLDYPTRLIRQGAYATVPLIVGSTTDEVLFVLPGQTLQQVLPAMYPKLSNDEVGEFQALYSKSNFPTQDDLVMTAAGEVLLRCGREILGYANIKKKASVWTYRYNEPNPTRGRPGKTEHAAENWMMFMGDNTGPNGTTIETSLNPAQTAFSEELIAYWISFARTFDPNTYKLSRSEMWPPFVDGQRVVLQMPLINSTPKSNNGQSGIVVEWEPAEETQRCEFIAERSNSLQI